MDGLCIWSVYIICVLQCISGIEFISFPVNFYLDNNLSKSYTQLQKKRTTYMH